MITIQSAMLVALGFLAACLLTLLVAPAFWTRAVRLTTQRIKETMPLTDVEIRADKDRIRAENAIKVHRLENDMEQVRLAAARQQIEINRRDARINDLEGQFDRLKASHEETQNARRVLEQTVSDRLPRVELRLNEAKKLLFARDREISDLTRTADRQVKALSDANAINAQVKSENDRLKSALAVRASNSSVTAGDARAEADVALRDEIEQLRAKSREQAQLLARLQSMSGRAEAGMVPSMIPIQSSMVGNADKSANGSQDGDAGDASQHLANANSELERQLRLLKSRNEDQSAEIARLKASLKVLEDDIEGESKVPLSETRIGMRSRVQALEAQNQQHNDTIQKLRAELAAANERIARQASHFTNELRRLGSGAQQASAQPRRAAGEGGRMNLGERVAQARNASANASSNVEVLPSAARGADEPQDGREQANPVQPPSPAGAASENPGATDDHNAVKPAQVAGEISQPPRDAERRPRLLDRISSLARTS